MPPDPDQLRDFARRYTEAWCSQDPAKVAEYFVPGGWRAINGGEPARTIGDNGLIAQSQGHFDQAEYDRQIAHGFEEPR
jgi:hypothetical protein